MKTLIMMLGIILSLSEALWGQQNVNALSFDGSNDYVSLGNKTGLKPTNALTIEAWLKLSNWNAASTMSIISSDVNQGYTLYYQSGYIVASIYGNNKFNTTSVKVSSLTGWHHLALSFDGYDVKIYVDGGDLKASTKNRTLYSINYGSASGINIGTNGSANGNYLMGTLDELRIWNITRTEQQLKASYTTELNAATTNLVSYYRLNQGSAVIANLSEIVLKDLTANANNGQLKNFALTGTTSNWTVGFPLTPLAQSSTVTYSNAQETSVRVNWKRAGNNAGGNGVIVFMTSKSTGTALPDEIVSYTANSIFTSGTQIKNSGWYCVYNGIAESVIVTGLVTGTTYRTHVIEYQSSTGLTTKYNTSAGTSNPSNYLNEAPTKQASGLVFSNLTYYSTNLSWTRGNGTSAAVFMYEGASGTAAPVNFTSYSANPTFKSGTQILSSGWYCVYNGTGASVTVNSLLPGRTYRAMVVEYTGTPGTEKYITTSTSGNLNNFKTTDFVAPTTQVSNLTVSGYTHSSVNLSLARGNGSKVIVFASKTNTGAPAPMTNTTYLANANFGSGTAIGTWYAVYDGTGTSITINGLTTGSNYRLVAYEYNGTALAEKYLTTLSTNTVNATPDYIAPTTAASNIVVSEITSNAATIGWTKGNGSNSVVFVGTSATAAVPTLNTGYQANVSFRNGSQIGASGWYCVYNGNSNNTTVTNLNQNSTYYVVVYDYNGTSGFEKYNTSLSASNPNSFITAIANTSWNGTSWTNGAPNASIDAILVANYAQSAGIESKNLTVNAGAILYVQAGSSVTVNASLVNNGTILLQSTSNNAPSGSFITQGSITNNGVMKVERYLSPGTTASTNQHWHLMGIPNSGQAVEKVFLSDYVMRYLEKTNAWSGLVTGNLLKTGEGYLVKTLTGKKVIFEGTFNTGDFNFPFDNTGPDAYHGYNLVGNPYPSAINWNATGWTKTNIDNTIWIWDPTNQRYMTWNGSVGQNGGSAHISAMQAFFVKVNNNTASGIIGMTNSTRVHSSVSFQKNARINPNIIRIEASGNDLSDELVLYTEDGDNDAVKFFSYNENMPQLFAIDDENKYSIFKINNPYFEKRIKIGLSCAKEGSYTLKIKEINLSNVKSAVLVDLANQNRIDLQKAKQYTFTHTAEMDVNRFEIILNSSLTSVHSDNQLINNIKVWGMKQQLGINVSNKDYAEVFIYNAEGKLLQTKNIIGSGIHTVDGFKPGLYLVKIHDKQDSYSTKVIIY